MKYLLSIVLIAVLFASGGLAQTEKKEQPQGMNLDQMSKAMQNLGQAMSQGGGVEPVNFRKLKALLPKDLPGMKRTSAQGEKTAAMGIKVAQATGEYSNGNDGSVTIKIMDMGTMKGFVGMATAGWAMTEIDRESDTGYERTFTYKGHKAMEEYDNQSKQGKISVLVGNRFVVEIDGDNVDMKAVKAALDKIDLNALLKMKDEGVPQQK